MRQIGIRSLREQTSEILRQVREQGESFEVTYRGRAIARIVPVTQPATDASLDEVWKEWERVSKEVSALWPDDVSAAQAISEDRRD